MNLLGAELTGESGWPGARAHTCKEEGAILKVCLVGTCRGIVRAEKAPPVSAKRILRLACQPESLP